MVISKEEFIARLDGSLENQVKEAYWAGFQAGHKFGWQFEPAMLSKGLEDWMIGPDFREWQQVKS